MQLPGKLNDTAPHCRETLISGSHCQVFCPQGMLRLQMFSVVTPAEEGDATGVQWAEAGDVAKHLIMYSTASHKESSWPKPHVCFRRKDGGCAFILSMGPHHAKQCQGLFIRLTYCQAVSPVQIHILAPDLSFCFLPLSFPPFSFLPCLLSIFICSSQNTCQK